MSPGPGYLAAQLSCVLLCRDSPATSGSRFFGCNDGFLPFLFIPFCYETTNFSFCALIPGLDLIILFNQHLFLGATLALLSLDWVSVAKEQMTEMFLNSRQLV